MTNRLASQNHSFLKESPMRQLLQRIFNVLFVSPQDPRCVDAMSITLHDAVRLIEQDRRAKKKRAVIESKLGFDIPNRKCRLRTAESHRPLTTSSRIYRQPPIVITTGKHAPTVPGFRSQHGYFTTRFGSIGSGRDDSV
ncbi:hypothetical protein RRSWK_00027 [Rhodopirellula sp. SWK7]|nr:hypothetical protein RRSWK_00027 [Rhodopirellula sp. SWK7]